mmetsp:Transcript_21702/g.67708  ORF Transcript_21702/g.67708 Transcript_21702/m.67708 type:complete len:685 (+) Transcript_21702:68-2122(+)
MAQGRVFATLMLLALPAASLGVTSSLTFDAAAAKKRPVSKVIKLLQDMQKQLEKEAKEDEEIYDKLACWCETNDKEKAKSISDAEKKIKGLTNKIDELTATSARLNTEIENLEKEVAENQEALSKATALREKQLEEFSAEEKDLLESISSLKAAVDALSKHNGEGASSLLQVRRDPVRQVADTIRHEMQRHATMLSGVLSHKERRATASFLQSPQEPYAPQSGEIFGILQQMQETFESNLKSTQTEEEENQQEYDELKKAKEAEIAAGQEQLDSKTQDLAATDKENAESKEDLEDTRSQLAADEEFLATVKSKCKSTDEDWERRQKARAAEVEACSKAISVLSTDEAVANNNRVFNPSLLQREAREHSGRRARASQLLSAAAQHLHSPRLSTLAYRVRLDAFKRVKEAIEKQIAELVAEKEDEIKQKDFCTAEFQENQLQTEEKEHEKEGLLVKMEDQKALIKKLGSELDDLNTEVAEMELQRKRAGEDRERENQEYLKTVAEQRQAQQDIKTAMKILAPVYGEDAEAVAFLARRQEPAPPGFEEYEKSEGGNRVMDMLKDVLADTKKLEDEAIRDEEDMQKAYEDFVKETNTGVDTRKRQIVEKTQEKAQTETDLLETTEVKDKAMLELEQLSNYNAQLHKSCDYLLKNFDVRQTARDEEIEALRTTIRILSGDKMAKFLQLP